MLLLGSGSLPRIVTVAPLIVLPIVVAFDAGSVALMQIAAEDNTGEAGRAAVSAIAFDRETTPEVAQLAYDAAKSVADAHGETVDPTTFRIHSDGSVTLTVGKSTDTVLFRHLPGLRNLTDTRTTITARRPTW